MDSIQQEAVKLALDKLFNKQGHFNICAVDKIADTLGVNCQSHPDYKTLNTLHCVDYQDMSMDLKSKLPQLVMGVLSSRFDTDLMSRALAAVSNGEIKDLPPIEDYEPQSNKLVRLFK